MTRYWTSDLHLGHKNIIEYDDRPFGDLYHMHQELIRRWNMVVKNPNDEVWVIGDVAFCKPNKAKEILSQMNGKKILVRGNHDPSIEKCYKMGFDKVFEENQVKTKIGGQEVLVCHYPYHNPEQTDLKYQDRRPKDEGGFLIHGHVHTSWKISDKMINVGTCVWNYAPISDGDLIDIMIKIDKEAVTLDNETAITQISEACKTLGWNMAIPDQNDDEDVKGMILGTDEYINEILERKEDA